MVVGGCGFPKHFINQEAANMAKQKSKIQRSTDRAVRESPTIVAWAPKTSRPLGMRAKWLTTEVTEALIATAANEGSVELEVGSADSLQTVRMTLGAAARRKGYKAHAAIVGEKKLQVYFEKTEG